MQASIRKRQPNATIRSLLVVVLVSLGLLLFWLYASAHEMMTGQRLFPWSAYALCGNSQPESLPNVVRIGLYEEFPVPWRLDKLAQLDFPITIALAAPSRTEFMEFRNTVMRTYPQVREIYFWPLLSHDEGYYPGSWSDADGVERVAGEADGLLCYGIWKCHSIW